MTISATYTNDNATLRDLIKAYSAKPSWDFFGIVSGFRASQIHAELDSKSDAELARLGLTRSDLPRVAFEAAQNAA